MRNKCEFCETEDKLLGDDLCEGCKMYLYLEEVRYDLEQEWNEILQREGDQHA